MVREFKSLTYCSIPVPIAKTASEFLQAMYDTTVSAQGREDMKDVIDIFNKAINRSQSILDADKAKRASVARRSKPFDPSEYSQLKSTPGIDRRSDKPVKKGQANRSAGL
jgi:hypothetical protein